MRRTTEQPFFVRAIICFAVILENAKAQYTDLRKFMSRKDPIWVTNSTKGDLTCIYDVFQGEEDGVIYFDRHYSNGTKRITETLQATLYKYFGEEPYPEDAMLVKKKGGNETQTREFMDTGDPSYDCGVFVVSRMKGGYPSYWIELRATERSITEKRHYECPGDFNQTISVFGLNETPVYFANCSEQINIESAQKE